MTIDGSIKAVCIAIYLSIRYHSEYGHDSPPHHIFIGNAFPKMDHSTLCRQSALWPSIIQNIPRATDVPARLGAVMPPSSDLTRAVLIAQVGRHSLIRLARHVALLLRAGDDNDDRILEHVYLAIAGLVAVLVAITFLLALLRWIRNVLLIILVVLVAAVVRAGRARSTRNKSSMQLRDGDTRMMQGTSRSPC